MFSKKHKLLSFIFSIFLSVSVEANTNVVGVWAFPDSTTVSGTINIGVVAYHSSGIDRVEFILNDAITSVSVETLNPDTNEYEYVLTIDTSTLADDEKHIIKATAFPKNVITGSSWTLNDLIIQVDNTPTFTTYYVDAGVGLDTNTGTSSSPFKTIGRALGSQHSTKNATPRAASGDLVILRTGEYDLPNGTHANFNKFVTLRGEKGAKIRGGSLKTDFLKIENVEIIHPQNGNKTGILAYASHIWIKNASYVGLGQVYFIEGNTVTDEAFRSRDSSQHVTIENMEISYAAQGISLIGSGNYIVRNNYVHHQRGDASKIAKKTFDTTSLDTERSHVNALFTGNKFENIRRNNGWSIAKKPAPYNFGTDTTVTFYISEDKGKSFLNAFEITFTGENITAQQVVDHLNLNTDFTELMTASLSKAPHPHIGNVKLSFKDNNEFQQFYVTGDTSNILGLIDNTLDANPLSATNPSRTSTQHSDFVANDNGNLSQFVLRNNLMTDGNTQGIKFDGIGKPNRLDFYKSNIAVINNVLGLTGNEGSRLVYLIHRGSGPSTNKSKIKFDNILFLHNTFYKGDQGLVLSSFFIENENHIENMVFKNNIVGKFHEGDWLHLNFENTQLDSDYNAFGPKTKKQPTDNEALNTNSIKFISGDSLFINENQGNYQLSVGSSAINAGATDLFIPYDINFAPRDSSPDIGAFEFSGDDFVTTWKTDNTGTSNSTSISIPTDSAETYLYDVDWENDGIFDDIGVTGPITHDYNTAGIYTVRIKGTFPAIIFKNQGDRRKIISIDQWGTQVWRDMADAYNGASNLTIAATDTPDLSSITLMTRMFRNATSLSGNAANFGSWDVSNVTGFSYMFENASLFNGDVSGWDMSSANDIRGMFKKVSLFNQDVSGWDLTGGVTSLFEVFANTSFNQNIAEWDTSNITNMSRTFMVTPFNQDISEWDTSNVANFSLMFINASEFNQDISGWDTSSATNMGNMFRNATSFDQNLGSWDMAGVTNIAGMFIATPLSVANYDSLLNGWNTQTLQPNLNFDATISDWCIADFARTNIATTYGWEINDGNKCN